MVRGIIVSYRRGRHTQNPKQAIIAIEGISKKEDAVKYIGKRVIYRTPSGKEIVGRISALHGNKGKVRAIFEKGLPGQAIGSFVEILNNNN